MAQILCIGTEKGLFTAISTDDRKSWQIGPPQFPMTSVYAVGIDRRPETPRLLASVSSSHFGPSVAVSDDLGHTWNEPDAPPLAFPPSAGVALEHVWQFAASPCDPGVVYAGAQPSALFKSTDGGQTFGIVPGLWNHPHRTEWGAGFGGQAVHTVLPHPSDPDRLLVAMSTGGVYRTDDAGAELESGEQGHQGVLLPRPLARIRAVRAQGCPGRRAIPSASTRRTTTGCTARTTAATAGRASRTACPPISASPWSPTPPNPVCCIPSRSRRTAAAIRRTSVAASTGPQMPGRPGRHCRTGFRRAISTRWSCATRCAPTTRQSPGCTSAPGLARCWQRRRRRLLVAGRRPPTGCVVRSIFSG